MTWQRSHSCHTREFARHLAQQLSLAVVFFDNLVNDARIVHFLEEFYGHIRDMSDELGNPDQDPALCGAFDSFLRCAIKL